jgi:hypothetical protein
MIEGDGSGMTTRHRTQVFTLPDLGEGLTEADTETES